MSVVLINTIDVPKGDVDQFLANWRMIAEYMRGQPGFRHVRVHRSIEVEPVPRFRIITVSEWDTAQDARRAHETPNFERLKEGFPCAGEPHSYEVVHEVRAAAP